MTFFSAALGKLTRESVTVDTGIVVHSGQSEIADIVWLLDGGGTELVRAAVLRRFATEIQRKPTSGIELTDSLTVEDFAAVKVGATAAAIESGLHTVMSTMLFNRIVETRASLFGAGSVYGYGDGGDSFEEDLTDARRLAHHDRRMSRLDMLATGVGSAGLLVKADALGYTYDVFDPAKIWVIFGERIETGEGYAQADTTNIEHASVVVLELSGGGDNKTNYVAYMGRQEKYPRGRLVRYTAESWDQIPGIGDGGFDWVDSGEWLDYPETEQIANPLTIQQDALGGLYEYPIATWQMDATADGTSLFPVTGTALYDQVFEMDVEASRIVESAGRSAAGAWFGTDENNIGFSGVINEGQSILQRGQSASLLSHAASNSKDALSVINAMAEQTATRWHVPAYMVAPSESFNIPSGVALKMMNLPLLQDRQKREEINKSQMARKFEIEKNLVNFVQGSAVIPQDATETWSPKPLEFPEDEANLATLATWQKHQIDTGMLAVEDLMVEMSLAETKESAAEMYEQNKALLTERTPAAPTTEATGIRNRLGLA